MKKKSTWYEVHDDTGKHEADTLSDAMSVATAPADIFELRQPPSMPAHGIEALHHWRLTDGRKLTQIR